jgi:hypothetical protein
MRRRLAPTQDWRPQPHDTAGKLSAAGVFLHRRRGLLFLEAGRELVFFHGTLTFVPPHYAEQRKAQSNAGRDSSRVREDSIAMDPIGREAAEMLQRSASRGGTNRLPADVR